jgi:hypothetical protein
MAMVVYSREKILEGFIRRNMGNMQLREFIGRRKSSQEEGKPFCLLGVC